MALKKSCDRCKKGERWGIINDGFLEISFSKSALQEAIGIKTYLDLCTECFEEFKVFMKIE